METIPYLCNRVVVIIIFIHSAASYWVTTTYQSTIPNAGDETMNRTKSLPCLHLSGRQTINIRRYSMLGAWKYLKVLYYIGRDIEQKPNEVGEQWEKGKFSGDRGEVECDVKISLGHEMPIIHSSGETEYLVPLWAELYLPKFTWCSPSPSTSECACIWR